MQADRFLVRRQIVEGRVGTLGDCHWVGGYVSAVDVRTRRERRAVGPSVELEPLERFSAAASIAAASVVGSASFTPRCCVKNGANRTFTMTRIDGPAVAPQVFHQLARRVASARAGSRPDRRGPAGTCARDRGPLGTYGSAVTCRPALAGRELSQPRTGLRTERRARVSSSPPRARRRFGSRAPRASPPSSRRCPTARRSAGPHHLVPVLASQPEHASRLREPARRASRAASCRRRRSSTTAASAPGPRAWIVARERLGIVGSTGQERLVPAHHLDDGRGTTGARPSRASTPRGTRARRPAGTRRRGSA